MRGAVATSLLIALAIGCNEQDPAAPRLDGRAFRLSHSEWFQPVQYSSVRVSFESGRVALHADCDVMRGAYDVRDGSLVVSELEPTARGCADPFLHWQDGLLADFLSSHPKLTLAEEELSLHGESWTLTFTDPRSTAPDLSLVGAMWKVSTLFENNDPALDPGDRSVFVAFDADGSFAVSGPCNRAIGKYVVAEVITLSDFVLTDAVCDATYGKVEALLWRVFEDGAPLGFRIDGTSLTIRNLGGSGVGIQASAP